MKTTIRYVSLGYLAATALYTGIWAYFFPASWYANFPGLGLSWLPQLGPYNEHLSKDTGALLLALAVLTIISLRSVHNTQLVHTTGAVWLVFTVLHFSYHVQHRDMYNTRDEVLNVVVLSASVLLAALLLVPVCSGRQDDPR